MCTTILVSNRQLDPKHSLSLCRRKDRIEKFFDSIKNDLDRKRLRTYSNKTFEGRLFLDFLALGYLFTDQQSSKRGANI